jgi:predicted ribosome quality control (RQC) complex YloA/Tae2 family protein
MLDYTSDTQITLKVGQSAKENDELRADADGEWWWFHVTNHPGAHVFACAPTLDRETKRDAAVLAVHHSKAPKTMKMTPVDMCRVRDVHKRPGAPHGQVEIENATILTVFMNKAVEKARLGRLLTGLISQTNVE